MNTSENKKTPKHWAQRFLLSKTFIIAVAVVVVYTLVGFFLVPYLIKRQMSRFAEETLKCRLTMEEVRVNPYALTMDIKNFDLKENDGSPLIAFRAFFINFQVSTVWNWAWTFADVRLDDPSLHIEMRPEGRLNLLDVVERFPKEEKERSGSSKEKGEGKAPFPRIVLEHIALNQGRLVFADRSDSTHASVTLEPIGLELRNFATLRDKKGMHSFEATLPQGGTLRWAGEMSVQPVWSEGSIEVKNLKVATVWKFLQDEVLLDKPEGEVAITARYQFAYDGKSPTLMIDGLKVLVSDLLLKAQGDELPIFSMEAIRLEEARLDLSTREFSVRELGLSRGRLEARVNEQGRFNFQELVRAGGDSKPAGTKRGGEPPWRFDFRAVSLEELSVNFSDRSRPYPLEIEAAKVGVKFHARLSYGPEKMQAHAEELGVTFSGVTWKEIAKEEPLATLDTLAVEGGRLDLEARQVSLESVRLEGGHLEALREKEGTVNLLRMVSGSGAGKIRKEIAEVGEKAKTEGQPWSVGIGVAEAGGFSVAFSDETLSPPATFNLENITMKLSDIQSDGRSPILFEASVGVKQGGSVKTKGRFMPSGKSIEATVQASNLSLTPLQPYLAQVSPLVLDSGALSLAGEVRQKEGRNGPSTTFSGNGDILDLLVLESDTGQRFLAWKSMKVNAMELSLRPDRLEIEEVCLTEPYGKLIIYEDQSVNFKKILRGQEEKAEEKKPTPKAEAPGGVAVNVRRIRIEKGNLDFADLSLRPQFAAKIHELNGAVVGLSTKEGERTQIQLEGRVDEYGTSKIQGQLEPFDAKRFTDVSMIFRNVEMTSLTPYSAKFAGYRIASGKLSLDLHYLIKDSELKGENQIILDKLTLGEKVDNPDAPNIPLNFALALLKDADDRIDIGLPVSGNLEDPQFSYGHLIWKALLNLFTKIITSPFRALSAMLGVEKENLGTIEFDLAKAVLAPPEQEKMKSLSEALAKRPQLTLKIQGRYDPAGDGAAMRSSAIRHEIARRIGRELAPGENAEPVDVGNPVVQQAIEGLVKERISPEAFAAAKEEALKKAAGAGKKAGKPVTKEDKGKPPALPADLSREFYTSLLQKLIETHPVTEGELQALGRRRAEAIKQELVAKWEVGEDRITVLDSRAAEEKSKETVASKLSLDVKG